MRIAFVRPEKLRRRQGARPRTRSRGLCNITVPPRFWLTSQGHAARSRSQAQQFCPEGTSPNHPQSHSLMIRFIEPPCLITNATTRTATDVSDNSSKRAKSNKRTRGLLRLRDHPRLAKATSFTSRRMPRRTAHSSEVCAEKCTRKLHYTSASHHGFKIQYFAMSQEHIP
jgi:hypothetical protein